MHFHVNGTSGHHITVIVAIVAVNTSDRYFDAPLIQTDILHP
jgi:hypothetical protein